MQMGLLRAMVRLGAIAMLMNLAVALNTYTVGAPNGGWDLKTALQAWANSNTFFVGDSLSFVYTTFHDVVEVSKADYDSCQASSPIQSFAGGNTVISLTTAGDRYFICGVPPHCDLGMKVVISTLLAPPSPPPATPPQTSTPAATPPQSSTPAATPPTPSDLAPATITSGSPTASVSSPDLPPSVSPSVSSVGSPPGISPSFSPSESPISITPAEAPAPATSALPPKSSIAESPLLPPFPSASSPSSESSSGNKISGTAGFITVGFGFVTMMMMLFSL